MKDTFFTIVLVLFFAILVFLFLKFVLFAVLAGFLLGMLRTWQIQRDARNKIFLQGSVPSVMPDGLHKGIFLGAKTSWRGKIFDSANAKGINLFDDKKGGTVEKYPFKTYTGKGLLDNKDVLKIDYNIQANPFWLAWIVDEVVQVAPGEYLGKMNLKIVPGFPFGILYFELKK